MTVSTTGMMETKISSGTMSQQEVMMREYTMMSLTMAWSRVSLLLLWRRLLYGSYTTGNNDSWLIGRTMVLALTKGINLNLLVGNKHPQMVVFSLGLEILHLHNGSQVEWDTRGLLESKSSSCMNAKALFVALFMHPVTCQCFCNNSILSKQVII